MATWRKRLMSLLVLSSLAVPLLSPLPATGAEPSRQLDDALDLMTAAQGILLEEDQDLEASLPGAAVRTARRAAVPPDSPADQILVRLINATKRELGELERACRALKGSFAEPGQECERQLLGTYCAQRIEQLRQRLSFLRRIRGDRRKALTRAWHSVKRGMANLWRRIGPLGRRFLRELGSDVLSVIQSGGSLHGGVLRSLVVKTARSVGGGALAQAFQRGVQRKIQGQARMPGAACGDSEGTENQAGGGDCAAEPWFDEAWQDVETLLIAEQRNCQDTAIYLFQECLFEQAAAGICQDEAAEACQPLYDAIPPNLPPGGGTYAGETIYAGAVRNEVTLTLSGDGAASGRLYFELYESVGQCTIKATTTVQGTFEPGTCVVRGTAQYEAVYDGLSCVSVCGIGPNAPAACPQTIAGPTVWEAELENDTLFGAIGDEACDPHCFGFSAAR